MWFVVVALVPIALIACMIRAWRPPTPLELLVLFVMYTLSGLGISLGWHRLFTHLGFKCKPPLRTALALAGSLAAEGSLASWVANHRQHHAHTDAPGDPHSPHLHSSRLRGFLHAHLGWLRFSGADPSVSAREILADPVLSMVSRWWWVWTLVGVFLPPLVASTFAGFSVFWGLCLWAGLFRIVLFHHVTWSVNSVCHIYGTRPFPTSDRSGNVAWLSLLSLGESWHNNHHASPRLARHGVFPGQVDVSAALLRLLEKINLAWDVRWSRPAR